jgi:heat shock protein HtpX
VVFVGMISFIAQMLWRTLQYGGSGSERRKTNPIVIVAAIAMGVGYLLALVLRFALSRTREYLADAGSVALTKNPEAMISALRKIAGHADLPDVPTEVRQMFIENPPSAAALFGLLATHPPVEARIRVLEQLAGLPPQHKSVIPEAG